MSVLIIEDDAISAKILEYNLTKLGHKTVLVSNGKQALEYLEHDLDVQLVITDIKMPEMNGLELLKAMKDSPVWGDIPVIVCSASADLETVKEAASLGCRYYLTKPFEAGLIARRVIEVLRNEKPIVKPPLEVKRQLGLTNAGYREIRATFCSLLKTEIYLLADPLTERSHSEFCGDLARLVEGAAAFGAERLMDSLNRLLGKKPNAGEEDLAAECQILLREMRVVLGALAKYAPDEPETGAGGANQL